MYYYTMSSIPIIKVIDTIEALSADMSVFNGKDKSFQAGYMTALADVTLEIREIWAEESRRLEKYLRTHRK